MHGYVPKPIVPAEVTARFRARTQLRPRITSWCVQLSVGRAAPHSGSAADLASERALGVRMATSHGELTIGRIYQGTLYATSCMLQRCRTTNVALQRYRSLTHSPTGPPVHHARVPCEYYRVPCEYYRVPCEYYRVPTTSLTHRRVRQRPVHHARVPCEYYQVPCEYYITHSPTGPTAAGAPRGCHRA